MSSKNRRDETNVDHFASSKDRRAERRSKDLLRRAHDVDEDWDEYELDSREIHRKRNQRMD
ncbi:hypothetical protein [Xanthomonas phage X1]|nr:hypothetical protein [Xanthomonas phage X1]